MTPWTAAHQAPLSMEFSRQEYWSRLPFPSLGDPPGPGLKPTSPELAGGFFTTRDTWEAPLMPQLLRRQPTRLRRPWDSPGKNTGVGCHFLLQCMKVKSESEVIQSHPTLCDPMDCSPPGSSVHGIFQARVLEWGATAFSIEEFHVYFL